MSSGADSVLIAGCRPGDCHYTSGSVKTIRRFKLLQETLCQFGIVKDHVRLKWVSASEGERHAQVAENMAETFRTLGPLNWNGSKEA